jgi:thiol-disulfide isomerase/thioredoxin
MRRKLALSIPILAAIVLAASSVLAAAEDPADTERRIIAHIKEKLKPGERLIVSQLYNEVFTAPEERAVLDKLNAAFFRVPLFIIEFESREGRLPTLLDISGQFGFYGPEEADVVLSIMESDPRVPNFITRDPETRELTAIDVEKVKVDERFNQAVTRTLTGWEGKPIPTIAGMGFDGKERSLAEFDGKSRLVYVWFTDCPPCVKIGPELVALQEKYGPQGFTVLGLNADQVLKLKFDDAYRAEYASRIGVNYPNLHLTPEVRAALGNVNIFPTLFLVDPSGTIVNHFVNFRSREELSPAIEATLPKTSSQDP